MEQIPNKNLTKEKANILGVLCGDGHISKCKNSTYEIGMRTIDEEFALNFKSKFEKVYGLILHIEVIPPFLGKIRGEIHRCKKQFRVRACSKKIYLNLLKYDPKGEFKTKTWRVPKEIMKSEDEQIICSFIRGFLDSEGTMNKHYLEVASCNKKGLDDVKKLFSQIGIERLYYYKDKKSVWKLCFAGRDNLHITHKKVGFTIHRKQKKLLNAVEYKFKTKTSDYWTVLNLRMKGYGYKRISKLTGINKWNALDWYEGDSIPHIVRIQIKLKNFPKNWKKLCNSFSFLRMKSVSRIY